MSFYVRPATPDDAAGIAEIHYAGWLNAYGRVVPAEQMEKKRPEKRVPFWRERIAAPDEIVLVARDKTGRMQGFIHGGKVLPHDITKGSLDGFDCEIYVLHCRKEMQGRGLGRLLIAEIARAFRTRGKTTLVLWAYTDNAYRPFYDRLGGQVVAEGLDDGVADVAYGWRSLVSLCPPTDQGSGIMTVSNFTSSARKIGSAIVFLICCVFAIFALTGAFSGPEISWSMLSTATLLFAVLPLPLMRLASGTARRQAKTAADPKATLTLKRSLSSVAGMVWMFAALATACGFGLASGIDDQTTRLAVWAGLIVFAILAASVPFQRNQAKVTLSPAGLDFNQFKVGAIAWPDIDRVEIHRVMRTRLISLFLRDEDKYFRRGFKRPGKLLKWTTHLVPSEFSIADATFDVPAEWLLNAIQVRLDHFGKADPQMAVQRQGVSA